MKKNKTVIFTVIYPQLNKYLKDYAGSIKNQDCKNFDLFFINDGFIDKIKIKKLFSTNISILNLEGTFTDIRLKGMKILCEKGYENIIFSDFDDFMQHNRVSTTLNLLKKNDIVVNDLHLVNKNNKILKKNIISKIMKKNKLKIYSKDILNQNFFGLSNTAIKSKLLKKILEEIKTDDITVSNIKTIDWLIFSIALFKKFNAIFTNDTATYYRIHNKNIAGAHEFADINLLLNTISVKTDLFYNMSRFNHIYKSLYYKYVDFKIKSQSNIWLNNELQTINKKKLNKKISLWWGRI